ncbi:MAG: LUD domain-containing protein [Methanobacteriaceae archaeon]|nr:LUD domain-containing protein [Candidatus Methanorudis spinitermitis]
MKDKELKTMRKSFQTLFNRRKQLLNNPEIKKLQEKVLNIRKNSIENKEELLKIATENFKNNDIDYYFAKDDNEANKIIFKIISEENNKTIDSVNKTRNESDNSENNIRVAKSKSNTLGEIATSKFLKSKNIEVIETDLGDRILQLKEYDNKPIHPTGPASHLNVRQIVEIINNTLKVNIEPNPKAIMETVKFDVLKKLANCEIGITGANAITSNEGSILLLHNEGNISLLSLMKTHIIVAGIDKIIPNLEDAMSLAKLESTYATGNLTTSYMNIISGPSKTADIEKKLLKNMYGARKIVVILLDNGRSRATPECLMCIGCGSCILSCPVYNVVGNEFGFNNYLGGRGVAMASFIEDNEMSFKSGLFMCTLCGLCTINCPVAMPTKEMIEKIRSDSQKQGFYPKSHKNIKDNIQKKGSPYD